MSVWKQTVKLALSVALVVVLVPSVASATCASGAQTCSTTYQVNEAFFGSGGELGACSTSYCSKQSAGETAVGNTASSNFQAQAGFNTNREPYIEFTVSSTNINLGELAATSSKTATATFDVKAYLSQGYQVVNASDPPVNGSYTMQAMTVPASSTTGTEQFGINLVANTSPVSFGANPVKLPDSTFAYGQIDSQYSAPNSYKYAKGDTVAYSTQSTSDTLFTVSYLFNISNVTPGGEYVLHHVLVATATY
jgi:hypothetical protein